jgi:TonB family protein
VSSSIYAKPTAPRIILRPALVSILLHVLIIYLMTVNWSGSEREIVRIKPAPKVINARLVDVSEFRPKPKPKPKAAPKAKTKPVVKAKPKPKPKPKPVVKPKAAPKPKPVVKEQAKPEPRITEQELAAIARADLARAVAEEEQAAEATATAAEMAASYASLIQQTVINYWSRPPSARNGMEALLAIQLIPTGEVVSVSVLKSSGNTAFDRSAMNAVEKAGSFPELQQLPAGEFEKTFRRFRLLFRPEDLRY